MKTTGAQSLKTRAIKGVLWNIIGKLGNQLVRFVLGLILARLLSPADYGLIGIVSVFFIFAQILIDSGLTLSLVQNKQIDDEDCTTVFWFNLIISILVYLSLYFLAPRISIFYEENELIAIIRVISISLIIGAFSSVPKALYSRQIEFRIQSVIMTGSTILGGIIGLACALKGLAVWALVFQNMSTTLFSALFYLILSKWKPKFSFSFLRLKRLFKVALNLLFSNILTAGQNNMLSLVIGKMFNSSNLGIYTRALQFAVLPEHLINSVLMKVFFPVLTKVQDDNHRMNLILGKILKLTSLLGFIVMLILIVLAEPLIRITLGAKWDLVATPLKYLAFAGIFNILQSVLILPLYAKGQSSIIFKLSLIKILITIFIIIMARQFSFEWFIITNSLINAILSYFIVSLYVYKSINFTVRNQFESIHQVLFINLSLFVVIKYLGGESWFNFADQTKIILVILLILFTNVLVILKSDPKEFRYLVEYLPLIKGSRKSKY